MAERRHRIAVPNVRMACSSMECYLNHPCASGLDGLGKIRPTAEERKTMSPEFGRIAAGKHSLLTILASLLWGCVIRPGKSISFFANFPILSTRPALGQGVPIGKYFAIGPPHCGGYELFRFERLLTNFKSYPLATGRVHITSGLDPHGNPDFHPGYMDE